MDSKKDDVFEEIDDDELQDLVLEAQRESLLKKAQEQTEEKTDNRPKHPFPRWLVWLISIVMLVSTFTVVFEAYSIPAMEFLKTSAKLSAQEDISTYKKAVVIIVTEDSKGTGFSISSDGTILTNHHVVEGNKKVTVIFPDDGRFTATVVNEYPDVDLAVLEIEGENLPHLQLAEQTTFVDDEPIYFIGNPLSFMSIANEGNIIDYIQLTDWEVPVVMMKAPVYRGNSGSPVLNHEGQVIGVVFATLDHEEHKKVGLFIPIDEYYDRIE